MELSGTGNDYQWVAFENSRALDWRVLDQGAGIGPVTCLIAEQVHSVGALASSFHAFGQLRELSGQCFNTNPCLGTLGDRESASDTKFEKSALIGFLEDIEDDEMVWIDLRSCVWPGSRIAVWVPNHELLYSSFDFGAGQCRRHSRGEPR